MTPLEMLYKDRKFVTRTQEGNIQLKVCMEPAHLLAALNISSRSSFSFGHPGSLKTATFPME